MNRDRRKPLAESAQQREPIRAISLVVSVHGEITVQSSLGDVAH
jgi:hypothetical protein